MKRRLGLLLFWLSWLLWGMILLIPLVLDLELKTLAVLTTVLIVLSETCFAVSLWLLGKPFYLAIKTRMKSLFSR